MVSLVSIGTEIQLPESVRSLWSLNGRSGSSPSKARRTSIDERTRGTATDAAGVSDHEVIAIYAAAAE